MNKLKFIQHLSVSILVLLGCSQLIYAQGFGIGTSNPTNLLHLYKNAADADLRFQTETGNAPGNSGATNLSAAADATGVGTITWGTTSNALSSDGSYATAAAGTSHYLQATGGFSSGSGAGQVPVGATINGVVVEVQKSFPGPVTLMDAMVKTATTAGSPPANFTVSSGGSNTNRLLVVVICYTSGNNSTTYGVNTLTYGTVAMTRAGQNNIKTGSGANARTVGCEIWYMNDANITTAQAISSAFAITWVTAPGNPANVTFYASSYKNVYQTTPVTFASNSGTSSPLSTSAALAVAVNDYVLWGAASDGTGSSGSDYTAQTGYTKDFDEENGNTGNTKLADEVEHKAITVAGNETPTSTATQAVTRFAIAAINIVGFGNVTDNEVKLIKGAGPTFGTSNKATGTAWPTTSATATSTPYVTYGSSTDLWGLALTQADVVAATFGVAISATVGTNSTARIDHVRITVYYTTAAGGSGSFTIGIDNAASTFHIANSTALGTSDRFIIDGTTGFVGIGTCPTPAYNLHVVGDIAAEGGTLFASSAVVSTTITACSDIRFKSSVTPLTNSLQNVLKMNGVNYVWKKNEFPERHFGDGVQIGFIAQEIEKIYPQFVATDGKGFKSVDYSRLTPVLVEAIKEQQKLIDDLNNQVKQLTQKVELNNSLELRLINLENNFKTVRTQASK